jgi:hypothetical protein
MNSINEHINKNRSILSDPTISPQSRRHLESELEDLEFYVEINPGVVDDPTPLELFCSKNPDAAECKIYED